jgi:hypothetical protein
MERRAVPRWVQSAIVVAVIGVSPELGATTPPPPPPSSGTSRNVEPSAEFSCNGKPLEQSRQELEHRAFSEYEKKGGRIRRAEWETKLVRRGCDWWVFFSLVPAAPGMHFGVLIDGVSGQAKEYAPGY